ncbi:phage antirepressor N-terminal domain-containing protein [Enterocloster clostridioformis]|uniref:Antirepressor protein ant N-terminal domain-containing protein n=1 Tax=Enterocloster clostridioformis TaxID=1531 RepID=A0AAP9M4U9_9FIRM|nr:hypothetical protein FOC47_27270 [Enterocloster clostridioformis]
MNTNAALQVTNFDFYGDSLIAIRVNATGEVYTVINYVLRGIGFTELQIKHLRKKWSKDSIVADGVQNFVTHDDLGRLQDTNCISMRKLPLALAKINITPKMKREQPELASKLELYQDKCADVLASVFLDNKSVSAINLQPLIDTITTLSSSIVTMQQDIISIKLAQENLQKQIPKKRFSFWTTKMFPKYQLLMDYFSIRENKDLYKELYKEFHNMYPDIELNQVIDDYCYENKLDNCYTLDAIEHDKSVRILFEAMVDGLLEKYGLMSNSNPVRQKTIFDDVVENIPVNHQKGPIINE